MARIALDRPRAPHAAAGAGCYESHYLKATDPAGGRAIWVRQTALKRPGQPGHPTLWATVFDRSASAPLARRTTFDEPLRDPGAGTWARFGGAEIGPGRAAGTLDEVTWDLTWDGGAEPNLYLPSARLYDRPLPRSGGLALTPATEVTGLVRVGDQAWEIGGWPAMVGHNWGTDHAAHWVWIHAALLPDRDGRGWVDLILARVEIGPLLTPWVVAGAMTIDGVRTRLGGPTARLRGFHADVTPESVVVDLPGGVGLDVRGDPAATVTWDYAAPHGPGRDVRNCSVADGTLTLPGGRSLTLAGGWALEVGRPSSP